MIQEELARILMQINYLKHAKESYKIDLLYYFKELF